MSQFLNLTLVDLLQRAAGEYPDNEAIVDLPSGERLTYGQLDQASDRAAKGFIALGLEPGDHVALWAPNLPGWLIAWYGMAKASLVLTSVELSLTPEQVQYQLNQAACNTLIIGPGAQGHEPITAIRSICPELDSCAPGELQSAALPELRSVIALVDQPQPGMYSWQQILDMGEQVDDADLAARTKGATTQDTVTLLYTSGTTGPPKGVMSSHFGIINTSLRSADNMGLTADDRLCLSVPLCHMFGCVCVSLTAMIKGSTIVIPSMDFTSDSLIKAVEAEACTVIFGPPNSFLAMMDHPDYAASDLSTLRTGIMGGAPCPLKVMHRVVQEMGVSEVLLGYGLTESSSWITQTRRDDPLELRVSTVGRALDDVEVKIVDPATGEEVPTGEVGEFCSRGFTMMGYYNMPAATAGAIDPAGWLHSGDMASVDEQGYVRISGRLKETINKGDQVIYPSAVEEVLFTHPAVANAQVFGVPSKEHGEEVAAWICLQPGSKAVAEELMEHCRQKLDQGHAPAYIKFVEKYPLTALGKAQKFKMREQYAKELGLE